MSSDKHSIYRKQKEELLACTALSYFHILMLRAKAFCLKPGKLLKIMISTTYSSITEPASGWSLSEIYLSKQLYLLLFERKCCCCSSHQTSTEKLWILQIYILLSAGSHAPQWHPVIWKGSSSFPLRGKYTINSLEMWQTLI